MLLRLRTDAEITTHSRRGQIFRGFRHPQGVDGPLALHVPHVSVGRVHAELSSRSGYHQPLQTTAGPEDEEARRAGDADFHHFDTHRCQSVVIVLGRLKVYFFMRISLLP